MTWYGGVILNVPPTVILNLIEDPFTSGFESLCYASELCHTSGVDTKGIRFAHTGSPIGVGDDVV